MKSVGLGILLCAVVAALVESNEQQQQQLLFPNNFPAEPSPGQLNAGLVNLFGFDKLASFSSSLSQGSTGFSAGFIASFVLIICTELGDKTFFIAALLAMKRGARVTFCGAFAALVIMTVISALAGVALPFIVDRKYTHAASLILFGFFGAKLLYEGLLMKTSNEGLNPEMEEVEKSIGKKSAETGVATIVSSEESSGNLSSAANCCELGDMSMGETAAASRLRKGAGGVLMTEEPQSESTSTVVQVCVGRDIEKPTDVSIDAKTMPLMYPLNFLKRKCKVTFRVFVVLTAYLRWQCHRLMSPSFAEAFSLTLTAEWGDRSQVATVALAASKNIIGVNLGAILGHFCCTGLAVLGGKFLAAKISEKAVTISGGISFLFFALLGLVTGL